MIPALFTEGVALARKRGSGQRRALQCRRDTDSGLGLSQKSFRPKHDQGGAPPGQGCDAERDFHGEKRGNETHASTTDPEAHKLLACLPGRRRKTVGTNKGYDTKGFVGACRDRRITPHIARNTQRPGGSALDGRTTRHAGYDSRLKVRKRIEEGFGWAKTIGQIALTGQSPWQGPRERRISAHLGGLELDPNAKSTGEVPPMAGQGRGKPSFPDRIGPKYAKFDLFSINPLSK